MSSEHINEKGDGPYCALKVKIITFTIFTYVRKFGTMW